MKLTTEDTESTELKPDQHEPVTLKLELTYSFEPSECLPDDWEGTREELVEWFRSDMAENFHSWVNRREIYDSIQEEDEKATTTELFDACKAFVKHIESLPDDTEKCRHLRLALENRPGELLIQAITKAEGRKESYAINRT